MSILGKLGLTKKKEEKAEEPKKQTAPVEAAKPKEERKPAAIRDTGQAHQILLRPILSEKGTHLAGRGEYVFAVAPNANKSEIRKVIQKVYDVHVKAVKIIKAPGKKRRHGRSVGQTSARKKALIKLRAGEKIPGIIEAVG